MHGHQRDTKTMEKAPCVSNEGWCSHAACMPLSVPEWRTSGIRVPCGNEIPSNFPPPFPKLTCHLPSIEPKPTVSVVKGYRVHERSACHRVRACCQGGLPEGAGLSEVAYLRVHAGLAHFSCG